MEEIVGLSEITSTNVEGSGGEEHRSRRKREAPKRWEPTIQVVPTASNKGRRGKKRKKQLTAEEKKAEKKLILKKKKKAAELEMKRSTKSKSAYAYFADDRRKELVASGMDKKEAREFVSNEWKSMSKETRKPYIEEAAASKDRAAAATAVMETKEFLRKLMAQRKAQQRAKISQEENKGKSASTKLQKKRLRCPKSAPIPMTADKFFEVASSMHHSDDVHDQTAWVYRAHGGSCRRIASVEYSDDQCTLCCEGGKLVLCSSCPRAYHNKCLKEMENNIQIEVSGDLGGAAAAAAASKKKKRRTNQAHVPDPSALALREQSPTEQVSKNLNSAAGEDDWHCPVCVRSHVLECICCGEPGDGETRLIPCINCPRAYHSRCSSLELVDVPGHRLGFRCRECVQTQISSHGDTTDELLSKNTMPKK
mmetsp:Transcript_6925/g.10310  ORF Transcript_6925/g.10310 Transcript_6925/m.10310 type:complete len:423 (-) Transcript_6925:1712-2980(-)